MGKKNEANYDVRIVTYDTSKGKVANISFHDGLSQLIADDGMHVRLLLSAKYPNRLYFAPLKRKSRDTVKMGNNKLQFAKSISVAVCSDFVGEYQLQCDDMGELKGLYYVNRDRVSQPAYRGGNSKVPHPNYTKGKRVAIPKQRDVVVPTIKKVEIKQNGITKVVETNKKDINTKVIIELLDVLDEYDKNETVYKAGHTLIQTIKDMVK